ncbi:Ribonuclease BN [Rubrivivax sp. A210]|uniref:YihY family inner membrane protein n=1 Tax=Rubrivivax sp. A210 TaxID=2772301 RepID=UPI00191B3622|nr:YihY family inner membrane protein [Rubrivivax sp. A210]CAD5374454.1 Ribonuclease BN [Rubrivivax sp. A210]
MTSVPRPGGGLGERGAAALQTLLQTLKVWPWVATLHTLRVRFREDRLGITAGSLTFTTLISLVPLVTVMLAVFTAFPMFSGLEGALEKYFLQNLVPDNIARPVMRALTQFAAKARGMGTAGLVMLVTTALALVLTIDRTLNGIWRVRRVRPLAQRLLVYWAALTLGPLALGLSLTLTSYAVSASKGLVSALPGAVSLVLETIQFLLLAAAVSGLFHYVPNTTVRWAHAWAGGFFVAVAFEGAKKGLAWYVAAVPTFSAVYGAFATVPILLLWIYLGWVIVLMGAVIAAYAPSLLMQVPAAPSAPGWRFELALQVLRALETARHQPQRGLTLPALAESLRVDPLVLEPLVDLLAELDWVARLDEGGSARQVLICEPERTPVAPLVERTLLAPGGASAAFGTHAAGLSLAQALRN